MSNERGQRTYARTDRLGHRLSVCTGLEISSDKLKEAKRMRRDMTFAERCFWNAVRSKRVGGLKFRRQQVIDGFIADFYCNALRLVVEIDGGVHERQRDYDRARDEAIRRHGLKVLRFNNDEVMNHFDIVIEHILQEKTISRASDLSPGLSPKAFGERM